MVANSRKFPSCLSKIHSAESNSPLQLLVQLNILSPELTKHIGPWLPYIISHFADYHATCAVLGTSKYVFEPSSRICPQESACQPQQNLGQLHAKGPLPGKILLLLLWEKPVDLAKNWSIECINYGNISKPERMLASKNWSEEKAPQQSKLWVWACTGQSWLTRGKWKPHMVIASWWSPQLWRIKM